jgi:hypothetical protein
LVFFTTEITEEFEFLISDWWRAVAFAAEKQVPFDRAQGKLSLRSG